MVEAVKIWNEPNNLSHWDFTIDTEWKEFSAMAALAARQIKILAPRLCVVLGGISPIDPNFITMVSGYGLLGYFDAVAVHGFPLDWNHWKIDEWPSKIGEIQSVCDLPVWVTEVGASTFGAEEIQVFGLRRTQSLLEGVVDRVYWYSLLDLPPAWEATTRHKESEGSAYYRHFYMGLIRADGTPKPSVNHFSSDMGICQWFHFHDPRLSFAVEWLKRLGVRRLRTGISWADWYREGAIEWFDYQMSMLEEFDVTITLCFTPPSRGKTESITSPPRDPQEFADFASEVINRYVLKKEMKKGI